MCRPHLTSTLFPYTTLFRSDRRPARAVRLERAVLPADRADGQGRGRRAGLGHAAVRGLVLQIRAGISEEVEPHGAAGGAVDRKSTRLNSSHQIISYAVFCLE